MSKKLILGVVTAFVVLVAGASSASAFTAVASPSGAITSVSLGTVTFSSGETTINCRLTLRGELRREITLVSGVTLGSISSVTAAECNNVARITILALPYTLSFTASLGTLPDNGTGTSFRVLGASFNISLFGGFVNCLYRGDQSALLATTDTGTNTYRTGLNTIIGVPLRKISGAGCPAEGELEGVLSLTEQTLTVR